MSLHHMVVGSPSTAADGGSPFLLTEEAVAGLLRARSSRPTVTRTVQKLTAADVVRHDSRKEVALTEKGRQIGREIVHRHDDLVKFFVQVLGLSEVEAERDTCQIEHGLSGKASQRLHEFLVYLRQLDDDERQVFERFLESVSKGHKDFEHLPRRLTDGWRS